MSIAERRADVTWEGDLDHGQGRLTVGSGAVDALPITWASRTARADGRTSPEELIAAAQAGCYAMALSHTLAQSGYPPTRLEVTATCAFDRADGGFKISTIDVTVHGRVPGLDQPGFETAARQAEQGCPVSNALRHNVEMRLHAHLDAG
jgi:osmotically inducible protein OsmC